LMMLRRSTQLKQASAYHQARLLVMLVLAVVE